ncbi:MULTISPECIES: hypothetical protein [unclassified Pseudomonas]|jgi:hypothetical protein|uniref:hypothetical protein n=1 Tax=unclassified Pseudomonas TaxID=196821 RepID=UPI000EA9FFB7|nr:MULTISPECIES: hypothetical protein [unclassified Pseudomonas]AYF88394.1 hypothetical protein D6Z43_15005 [Pseudomonas sp. DY-1]MDH4654365.1 hypothetical protein [Pseudomonas sp. BN606]MRK23598.1 hypothetical protein [Pseudomonas sp. JG-B]
MNNVARIADLQGDRLLTASYALNTIADLLGCDGLEHHLSDNDLKGLHHAVKTISDLMKCSAMDLYNVAEKVDRKD